VNWPRTIPPDLKKALEDLDAFRFPIQNQDRWAVIRDWLETIGTQVPGKKEH
jgi:hypothetical protein